MNLAMSEERCELCRFYLGDYSLSTVEPMGHCRRYPPLAHEVQHSGRDWHQRVHVYPPIVAARMWCGEFAHADTDGHPV
jgi:hypothetical protein